MSKIINELKSLGQKNKAQILDRFFKTGPGQYGYGDKFLGVMVPQSRLVAKKYQDISLTEVLELLANPWHEVRLTALLILVFKYQKGDEKLKKEIFNLYLKNTKYINNWDLVDLTAPKIVGAYLLDKDREVLYKLADSKVLWERRIAIIATFTFLREKDFTEVYALSKKLLGDKEDLMHKAVGWMLREAGKRDLKKEMAFLDKYSHLMPRTMLRYAIEKFPQEWRFKYLQKPSKMIK